MQTCYLGSGAEQDALIVSLVLWGYPVDPQRGFALGQLLLVPGQRQRGLHPLDRDLLAALGVAHHIQGFPGDALGRHWSDEEVAGGLGFGAV